VTTGRTDERDKDTDKKEWSTPKLRVFTRTTAEEMVLAGCKRSTGSGPGVVFGNCRVKSSQYLCSGPCDSVLQS
jgi:hypothetical protein